MDEVLVNKITDAVIAELEYMVSGFFREFVQGDYLQFKAEIRDDIEKCVRDVVYDEYLEQRRTS